MKKKLLFILLFILLFSFVSCKKKKTETKTEDPTPVVSTLDSPVISLNAKKIIWTKVLNAESYDIYQDNVLIFNTTRLYYNINDTDFADGDYVFYIIAKAEGFNSSTSNSVTYTKFTPAANQLEAPQILLNNNKITWSKITNATSFDVYQDGELVQNVTTLEYTIDDSLLDDGDYVYTVIAKATGYVDSISSNSVTFTKTTPPPATEKIDTAVIVKDTLAMRWDSVLNATSYVIYDGEEEIKTVSTNYVEYSDLNLTVGEHTLSVVVKGTGYLDSDKSNSITYTQIKKVVSLDVTCTKTTYKTGEIFDSSSLTVIATYNDGSSETVENPILSISGALTYTDKKIIVSYGKVGYELSITVENLGISVQEAKTKSLGEEFTLQGIIVGIGSTAYRQVFMVKDENSNDLVGVTNLVTSATATKPSLGDFKVGDKIVMPVKVVDNASKGISNVCYTLAFNGSESETSYVVSSGNSVEFDKTDVKTITSQEELNALFSTNAEAVKWGYSYIKLSGKMYFVNSGTDYNALYSRIVFDKNITSNAITCEAFSDRALSPVFRNNISIVNTGKGFSEICYGLSSTTGTKTTYDDMWEFYGDIYCYVCGGNSYYIQFGILSEEDVVEKEGIIEEITIQPNKVEYAVGEELDLTGCYIKTKYEDGNVESTTVTSSMVTSTYDKNTVGIYTITVTYNEIEYTFDVEVK